MASSHRPITTFKHVQETPALVWAIEHNMGDYPVVDVYISVNGVVNKVIPRSVAYVDNNTVNITFTGPQSGFATMVA